MNKQNTIFGIYPVLEAFKAGTEIDKIYIQKGFNNDKLQEIVAKASESNTTVQEVPIQKLNKLTKGNHQGVVAISSPIHFVSIEKLVEETLQKDKPALFLILDQITDVRNFGAIVRTAECVGANGIIIPKTGAAPVSGDMVKTSAGAIFNVPICKVDHIKDAVYYLQGSGIKVVAATEKSNDSLYQSELSGPLALIMGSEGKGVTPSVLKLVDDKIALPLMGKINSLNVSVACGAFLYEIIRQRSI
jgi:23S rRNA (guanosine2251-2'-O)-methyltransferase